MRVQQGYTGPARSMSEDIDCLPISSFNPVCCKVEEYFEEGIIQIKMLLHQSGVRMEQNNDHPTLKKYIDGWLHYKEKRFKYEKYWFVLKGQLLGGGQLTSAFLFCFKDQNTHVKSHFVGSTHITQTDTLELHKIEGNDTKPWKCDFTVKLNGQKLHFRAQDNIERDRWIYALVDLVGQQLPPSDLPTLNNGIRPRKTKFSSSVRLPLEVQDSIVESEPAIHPHHRPSMPNISTPGSMMLSTTATPPLSHAFNSNDYATGRFASMQQQPKYTRGMNTSMSLDLNKSHGSATLNGKQISEALHSRRRQTMPNVHQQQHSFTEQRILSRTKSPTMNLGNCTWYYGPMSRMEAEGVLHKQPVGSYLLRDCQSKQGCFTLTFKDRFKMKNHMILPTENGLFEFNGNEISKAFNSPEDGVLHYMEIKKSCDFHPAPFIVRSPGDGQEDDSYLQTDEIQTTDLKTMNQSPGFRPPMLRSPSLPEHFNPQRGPFYQNALLYPQMSSNLGRSTSHPHLPECSTVPVSNTKTQRKSSNIEMPTYLRRKSGQITRMVSLDDHYEEMQSPAAMTSPSRKQSACLSIKEDEIPDDSYLIDSEINLESVDKPRKVSQPNGNYVNSSVQSPIDPNKPRRPSYNYPLPPTPEQIESHQDNLQEEEGYVETSSILVEEQDDAPYLELNSDSNEQEYAYNAPLPPTPTNREVDHTYEESEEIIAEQQEVFESEYLTMQEVAEPNDANQYLDMNAATGYIVMQGTIEENGKDDIQNRPLPIPETTAVIKTDTPKSSTEKEEQNGYMLMDEPEALPVVEKHSPGSQEVFKPRDVSMNLAKRGSLVLPGAPKTNIKKLKGGSLYKPPPRPTLSRQITDPTIPSVPSKDIMESQSLLRKLNLDPLPHLPKQYEHKQNAPPLPPPRQERPQRLTTQSTIT